MYSNPHKNDPAGATPQAPQSPKIPASTYIVYVPLVVNASVSVLLLFLYTFFALVFTFLFLRAKIAINNEVLKIAFILKLRYRYPKSR